MSADVSYRPFQCGKANLLNYIKRGIYTRNAVPRSLCTKLLERGKRPLAIMVKKQKKELV